MLETETWIALTKHFGLWGSLGFIGLYLASRGCKWIAAHCLKPLIDGHLKFLDSMSRTAERQQTCMESMRSQLTLQTSVIESMRELVRTALRAL